MPKDKKPTKKPVQPKTIDEQIFDDALAMRDRATACETIVETVAAVLGVELVGELTLETLPHNMGLLMTALRAPQQAQQAQLAVPPRETPAEAEATYGDPPPESVRELLQSAARELGLASGNEIPLGELAGAVNDEILRIKGGYSVVPGDGDGPTVETGDSLAQAIDHIRHERRKLEADLVGVRMIVNRVAAVLNVPSWDSEGTGLLAALNDLKASSRPPTPTAANLANLVVANTVNVPTYVLAGLIRNAEFNEKHGIIGSDGKLWDDQCREALEYVRESGLRDKMRERHGALEEARRGAVTRSASATQE